jgi:CMP-N,N'-diacetyllegionaminic acid synthase
MNVLGIVPARGGSKGIPDKNLRELAGKPLLAYTVEAAQASGVIDRLVLSTDSDVIAKLGRKLGLDVPFMRPARLARDESSMLGVLQHAVAQVESEPWKPDLIVLLQPTSPLRRPEHVRRAVELLTSNECDSVVSVVMIPHQFAPQKALRLQDGKLSFWSPEADTITRRQQLETMYAREGTVYVCWRDVLMEKGSLYGEQCLPLVLPAAESLNLDSLEDWQRAEERLQLEKGLNG